MTLVVACVTPDIGFLVADTLLSVEFELKGHVGPVDGKFHALKIQILNGDIAVAFAGDAEASFNLIKNLQVELSADPKMDVASHLFESYKQLIANAPQQPPDCEFLVLRLTPEGRMNCSYYPRSRNLYSSRLNYLAQLSRCCSLRYCPRSSLHWIQHRSHHRQRRLHHHHRRHRLGRVRRYSG
jgi:hypothetical protein